MYDQSTPNQSVGSDFSSHSVTASVSGLVPNALYHVRLVATNSAGTTIGPDVTFTTPRAAAPAPPSLGKSFTGSATGLVLIQINGKFVPLTELSKIPNGAIINALHGHVDAEHRRDRRDPARHACGQEGQEQEAQEAKDPDRQVRRRGLQGHPGPLRAGDPGAGRGSEVQGSSHLRQLQDQEGQGRRRRRYPRRRCNCCTPAPTGKFRTKGRYSAATIRGTIWTIADRCDGTLVHAIKDTVTVDDFVRHKTIALHPGHSYLALAHPPKVKKNETHK